MRRNAVIGLVLTVVLCVVCTTTAWLMCCVVGLNALQLLNAAAAGSAPNASSLSNSYSLYYCDVFLVIPVC